MDELDDFLKGPEAIEETVETPEPETTEAAQEPEESAAPVRDEKGRFAPKGEQEPVAQTPEASAPPALEENPVPVKALQEERRKRQELEARLAEYEARLSQTPPQPAPDIWEEPDGYFDHRLNQVLPAIEQRVMERLQNQRIAESADEARTKFADYEEVIGTFQEMMKANPVLEQQLRNHRNPAEFAYSTAKTQREIQQYGSLDALIQARVQAEAEKLKAQYTPPAPSIPDSLAEAQSARSSAAAPFAPPTLDEILGRK